MFAVANAARHEDERTAALRATQPAGNASISKSVATVRQRVETYIDQNLTSDELAYEQICAALALSPSSLYRAFAHAGGITAYIRKRRPKSFMPC
jgi:AraC-like DNA-binding protein